MNPDHLTLHLQDFADHLADQGRARKTIERYVGENRLFVQWLEGQGSNALAKTVTTQHIRGYLRERRGGDRPATYLTRYNSLLGFWKWASRNGVVDANPMAPIPRPQSPPLEQVPLLTPDDVTALIRTTTYRITTQNLRDAAILHLFRSTPLRLGELTRLTLDDVDLGGRLLRIGGSRAKNRKFRVCRFDADASRALARYLRVREEESGPLFLGQKGPLTESGVRQMVQRRGRRVGVKVHPHQFRHTFADGWLTNGGAEGDLMALAGWETRAMLDRYGRARREARALDAYDRVMG